MALVFDYKLYEAKYVSQETAIDNVINKCKEKGYTLVEPFKYIGASNTKLKLKCDKGHIWDTTTYDKFVNGNRGCPICGGGLKKSQEHAEKMVLDKCSDKNYTLKQPFVYDGAIKTILSLKCNKDGHEWLTNYNNFINHDKGCAVCARNLPPTQDEAVKTVLDKCKKRNYKLVEPFHYKNEFTKIHLMCNKHNYKWKPAYVDFIYSNTGCPICRESRGEFLVNQILEKKFSTTIERQYRFSDLRRFPFDFYLPQYNICIEYDGIQHFEARDKFGGEESYEKTKLSDEIKNKYCQDNNIYLYRISYKDDINDKLDDLLKIINNDMNKNVKTFEQFINKRY